MSTPAPQLPLVVRQAIWHRIWDRLLQPLPSEATPTEHPEDPSMAADRTSMREEGSS
jgi:hypothetical protein